MKRQVSKNAITTCTRYKNNLHKECEIITFILLYKRIYDILLIGDIAYVVKIYRREFPFIQ